MFSFDNSYSRLPELFYAKLPPVPVRAPELLLFNQPLAQELGITAHADMADIFAGNLVPAGAEPIAQAYAGHQFGHFNMLGDGRAILLGEHLTPDGTRVDVQLKGSGRTPFSRSGDGRAGLGPMLREYIISEAMHALAIPTTRSLAVTATGEPVTRATLMPGAVLTRIAASHLRVGTFEYAARLGQPDALRALADYAIQRHYPEIVTAQQPYLALLQAVIFRQASLVAKWMQVGFIHGVMNTDNMAISGETIDYGPCAFVDAYDPLTVFSSIDRQGRYAFINQPAIAQWNLARFAETLLPLLHTQPEEAVRMAEEALNAFPALFEKEKQTGMNAKLGLLTREEGDAALVDAFLTWMKDARADYTNSFRAISGEVLSDQLQQDARFMRWHAQWQERLARQTQPVSEVKRGMRAQNPAIIARNYFVEEALNAAVEQQDIKPVQDLLATLTAPYEDLPQHARYREPPVWDMPYQTFCGT